MALLYKEDWEKTKARYLAWWAHEALGRCAIAVTAPKDNAPDIPEPKRPPTPDERWTDLDYISALNEYRLARTYYGGEMFPVWTGGHPGNKRLAVFLGCPITLSFDTGWLDPILTGENIEYESLRLDESEPHFQFTLKLLERAVRETKGKSIPSLGAFGGCGDTLAALRGNEQLLYDLIERPDQVRAADQHIMEIWCTVYDRFYNILKDAAEGSTCWFTLWSPQKFFSAHNDFSYMISPKDFVNLFLPTIERQTNFLDHTVYHVDGVGAFAHVDALCELPRLQAIQIQPGSGQPGPLHFMPLLKKVQAAGKNLHISLWPNEIETALSELSARGLFIRTHCETEAEARALLKNAEKWSKDRKVS